MSTKTRSKIFLLVAFSFARANTVHGQDSLAYVPKNIIKVSVLHLLMNPRSLNVAFEHRLPDQVSAQVEAGFLLPFAENRGLGDVRNVRGWRLREEFRCYFAGRNLRTERMGRYDYYFAVEMHQNIMTYAEFNDTNRYREHGYGFKMGF